MTALERNPSIIKNDMISFERTYNIPVYYMQIQIFVYKYILVNVYKSNAPFIRLYVHIRIRTKTLVATGTNCTDSCKSNYHTTTTTTALILLEHWTQAHLIIILIHWQTIFVVSKKNLSFIFPRIPLLKTKYRVSGSIVFPIYERKRTIQ